jgi:hypothetical protein
MGPQKRAKKTTVVKHLGGFGRQAAQRYHQKAKAFSLRSCWRSDGNPDGDKILSKINDLQLKSRLRKKPLDTAR